MNHDALKATYLWVISIGVVLLWWVWPGPSLAQNSQEDVLINNVFFDTELRQVIQDIGVQAQVTIIAGPEVSGLITAEIKDLKLADALNIVLAGTSYEWAKKEGVYLIYSTDPDSTLFSRVSETKIINLKYVTVRQVIDLLPDVYKRYVTSDQSSNSVMITATPKMVPKVAASIQRIDQPSQFVQPDPNNIDFAKSSMAKIVRFSNTDAQAAVNLVPVMYKRYVSIDEKRNLVMINAPFEMVPEIESILRSIDQPLQQVLLDARVVSLDYGDMLNLGIEWEWPTGHAGWQTFPEFSDWGVRIGLTTDSEFTANLMATLNLLRQQNEATIVASPQVMAQDGKPAEIKVTTEEWFQISSGGVYTNLDLEKIETGTIMNITPRIGEDSTINIELQAEVSNVVSRDKDDLPVIRRRNATSRVRIKDGGTIAIAGLIDNRSTNAFDSTPGISDVPLVGELFKNRNNQDTSRHVAIFVTARIIPDKPDCPPKPLFKDEEKAKAPLPSVDPESFKEELRSSYDKFFK